MAETLISPGVLARENDQSQITSQPVQAGAAIVGPTVKGQVNIPKLVTSYSEYLASFGSTFISGSDTYSFLTSISAFNYFQNGGETLLVTRVAKGTFAPAVSTEVYNAIESGEVNVGLNFTGSLTYNTTVNDFVAETYVNPTSTNSGAGTTPDFTVVVSDTSSIASIVATTSGSGLAVGDTITIASSQLGGGGALVTTADALLPSITQNLNFTQSATPGVITEPTFTTSGTGTLAKFNVTMANTTMVSQSNGKVTLTSTSPATVDGISGAGVPMGSVAPVGGSGLKCKFESKSSVLSEMNTVTAGGEGFSVGDVVTFTAADLTADGAHGTVAGDVTLTLTQPMMQVSASAITVSVPGVGYAAADTLTVAAADLVAGSDAANTDLVITLQADDLQAETSVVWTLAAGDIDNADTFVLETLSEGAMMNSQGSESTTGALVSGSADNFRWEITNPDVNSGVFSVIIRQGNDKTKDKSVVETFPNCSLDPKASNYIERMIGNQRINIIGGGSSDPYLQTSGSFPNASRYVRVKSVFYKTPDYFDNDGNPKSEYTASIPLAQSGTFDGASGDLIDGTNDYFYDNISNVDTQGVSGSDYIDAFNILANKDDFKYNLITAPGLVYAGSTQASPLNILISNTENRGDAIVVLDLEYYSSTITNATNTAATLDSSYVAAYWPWVQITDPDTRQLCWVPASTMIPGVYAYNDKAGEAWFAPAGINRGGLGTVRQAERKLTQANRDSLYTGKVNPIATFPGRGVVVFGQKTLQTKASALDRVNVRRLLIELKSYISQIADNLVFEQNTQATRNNFLSQVNPYLENVQQRQGLYAFKVVMDDSNNTPDVIDRNQLVGAIYLQPTKTAEFIYLDFNILPTGATFPS